MLNSTNPDLSVFKAHGHKLIVYHGWADWLVAPQKSIHYYEAVANAQAIDAANHHHSEDDETQGFYRLFMVPGMSHCSGGPGLNAIDALPSLESWVEKDMAPEEIIAQRVNGGSVMMTRPVCPYPKAVHYSGSGSPDDAANFSCVAH